jgi:putative oxidoreductase
LSTLVQGFARFQESLWQRLAVLDGLAPLAMRLYLAPVMWMAGTQKIREMDNTIEWFGNAEYGLGLPLPWLLAHLAAYTEAIGALLLLLGLATRWIAVPLLFTMTVAAVTVHWGNGWAAIADSSLPAVAQRLGAARDILNEHGNYAWLTGEGPIVILNNGIEFAATYFIMLLALLFIGGGRYVSVDYYLGRLLNR